MSVQEALERFVGAMDDVMDAPGEEVTQEQAEVVASAYVELRRLIAKEATWTGRDFSAN